MKNGCVNARHRVVCDGCPLSVSYIWIKMPKHPRKRELHTHRHFKCSIWSGGKYLWDEVYVVSQTSCNRFSLVVCLWYTNRNGNMRNEVSSTRLWNRIWVLSLILIISVKETKKILSHASLLVSLSCPLALPSPLSCPHQPQMPKNGSCFSACVMKQLASLKLPGHSEE